MELFFLSALILLSLFISATLKYLFYNKISCPNLPPGKMGLPLIGETLEFLSTGRKGCPEKFILDRIAKYSNVFKTSIISEPTVVLCGAAGNKFLFSNENKLVEAWFPHAITKIIYSSTETSTKEEAKKLKKFLPSFIKPEALIRYISMMDSIAQRHFEACWEGKQEVSVFALSKRYTFWLACKVFMSIEDPAHVAKLADPFNALVSGIFSIPIDLPGTPFNRAIKASDVIRKEIRVIIKQRKIDLAEKKASPTQDILSHMLLATDENGQHMSELCITDQIIGLLVGGHDSVTGVITCIIKYLSELPHIYNEVLKEQMEIANSKSPGELLNWEDMQKMKYSWNVACEVMRLTPPGQGFFREALKDFMFSGFSIPQGWKLFWTAYSTHWNPEYFPEPEKFDPSRFEGNGPAPYTYVPFGGGPRMCPGREYARLVILVFMHNVVKRFNLQKILPDEKIIVDPISRPAKGLPIRLIPHKV